VGYGRLNHTVDHDTVSFNNDHVQTNNKGDSSDDSYSSYVFLPVTARKKQLERPNLGCAKD